MRRLAAFCLFAACWGPLVAQQQPPESLLPPSPSHAPIPRIGDDDPIKAFTERLSRLRMQSDVSGVMKEFRREVRPARGPPH